MINIEFITIEEMEKLQETMEKSARNRALIPRMKTDRSGHDKRQTYERHTIKTLTTLETLETWIEAARNAGLT